MSNFSFPKHVSLMATLIFFLAFGATGHAIQVQQIDRTPVDNTTGSIVDRSNAIVIQKPGESYEAYVHLPFEDEVRRVSYMVSKAGDAIYQDDINLGNAYTVQRWSKDYEQQLKEGKMQILAARSDEAYKWPGGVVPYKISGKFNQATIDAINDGINELNTKTNVQIIPYVKKSHKDYVDIIKLDNDDPAGGSSAAGRQGKRQSLSLKNGAAKSTVIHEFIHALGIFHEQSRADRDDFVKVKMNNVAKEKKHNFDKIGSAELTFGRYDLGSIMHYDGFAFSRACDITRFGRGQKCGYCNDMVDFTARGGQCFATIVDRKTNQPVIASNSLSPGDIEGINAYYAKEDAGAELPPISKLRTLRTTVERVITREGPGESGICGTKTDYVYKIEAGPVMTQAGLIENALILTESTFKEDDKPYRSNDFRPSGWRLTTPITQNTELMRLDVRLWDHDDAVCGGKDDIVDINPTSLAILHLLVNTENGDLHYLRKEDSGLPGLKSFPRGTKVGNIFDAANDEYLTFKFNGLLDGQSDYTDESEVHIKIEVL